MLEESPILIVQLLLIAVMTMWTSPPLHSTGETPNCCGLPDTTLYCLTQSQVWRSATSSRRTRGSTSAGWTLSTPRLSSGGSTSLSLVTWWTSKQWLNKYMFQFHRSSQGFYQARTPELNTDRWMYVMRMPRYLSSAKCREDFHCHLFLGGKMGT